ncbi:hypothetical protein [uncultured Fibrobacter sp.]|uniref:hypothetical protein n=1 Tax=uncultured Fibrobacter sp. TaxID=261512 RepID=UPI00262E5983|nr:hypothetical protein [uncultured Fibrobacter sp.]
MNIRRFVRLGSLSVASLFWASCGSDSSSQVSASLAPEPDSSADAVKSSSSEEESANSSATSAEESSSSEQPTSSSAEIASSADEESSSSDEEISSSSEATSSSSEELLRLARDTSVTCSTFQKVEEFCPTSSEPYYSCTDLQEFLKKDTTVSEKILDAWEEKLMSCDAYPRDEPLYGIISRVCPHYAVAYLKCSDGKTYKLYKNEDGLAYTTEKEYYATHSSSSVAESSSSSAEPEDLVTNCPQDSFAVFADILADVQKELYEIFAKELDENDALPEAKKAYLASILDREKKTMNGNLFPYYSAGENYNIEHTQVYNSEYWFEGYIAKLKTCAGGEPETTALYRETYDEILQECLGLIRDELNKITE